MNREPKLSDVDADVFALVVDIVPRIEAIAKARGESPLSVFTWFVAKLVFSVANGDQNDATLALLGIGVCLDHHMKAVSDGRFIAVKHKGGAEA